MARKRLGPERQQWKGIDGNEAAFGRVNNALVAIVLDGVAGVSPEIPGEGWRMVSPEKADQYIERGRRVLADFESQEMAPGGARGRAQKWMDRHIDTLRRLVTDAESVRSGSRPQKQTPESYGELRKSLGVGEAREPVGVDRWWSALPPGVESKIDCSDAKAMVAYRPYQGTPYDVSRSSSAFIEVCFASLKEARRFFDQAISSGHIEQAELLEDAKGHMRGRLIDDFNDNPIVGEARRYPKPKLPPRQFVAPRVADFNNLDDLVEHARAELGATHVEFEHDLHGTYLYFPRKDGQYEKATTWQKAGYWHAQGPGSREIVRHLPEGAQAIGRSSGRAEAWEEGRQEAEADISKRRLTRSTAKPGMHVRVCNGDSMYRGEVGTIVELDARRAAKLDNFNRRFLKGEGTVLVERRDGSLFVIHARDLERDGTNPIDRRHGPRTVRDYTAVDPRGRTIAGPFKSYSDAKQAAGPADVVQFVPQSAPPRASEARRQSAHHSPERTRRRR